jgi:8-oxo-dGTP pyrophosphatase MutT (NUDIX family)
VAGRAGGVPGVAIIARVTAPFRTIGSELALDRPWYRVRRDILELPGGEVIDYYVSERPDAAITMPVTPHEEVVLVRQYKHGAGRFTLELPAGVIDAGEAPADAARRELREETGYTTSELRDLGAVLEDTTKNTNTIFCFLALGATRTDVPVLDATEAAGGVEVELHALRDVPRLLETAEVQALSSVATLLKGLGALRHLG